MIRTLEFMRFPVHVPPQPLPGMKPVGNDKKMETAWPRKRRLNFPGS
jgi:hypothetical protein